MGRRKRKTFVSKFNQYWKQPDLCHDIKDTYFKLAKYQYFDKRHIISKISNDYKIKPTSLRYWVKQWQTKRDWDPTDTKNKGKHHRIFNDEQEKNIAEYIEDNYIEPHNYFSNSQFQTLAFEAYDNIYRDAEDPLNFSCSKTFITDFKNKYCISSRLAHFKERKENLNLNENVNNEEIDFFKAQIRSVIENAQINKEPVVNADETGFQILPNSIKTWAYKGTKNISISTPDSTKQRISVMASITSNYCKIPLFIIGQGNSLEEAEEQVGQLREENNLSYSAKSYMTTNCFLEYLDFLRKQFNENIKIHLIIDSYSTHTPQKVKTRAQELNIELYYIPSGFTDMLQPLDVAIFAPLKSITNGKIGQFLFGNHLNSVGMKTTVQFIQEAWDILSIDNLIYAWEQYQ